MSRRCLTLWCVAGFYATTGPTSHPAGTASWFPFVIVFVLVLGVIGGVVLLACFLVRPLRVQQIKADQDPNDGRHDIVELEELSEDAGVKLVE